ncbi:MAG: RNA polymerase III-inhibiting protein maf1 [Marteilia pararefringens]
MQGAEHQDFYKLSSSLDDNFSPPSTFQYGTQNDVVASPYFKSDGFSPPESDVNPLSTIIVGKTGDDSKLTHYLKSCANDQYSKIIFYLINALNLTFSPDYDFSHCQAKHFTREADFNDAVRYIDDLMGKTLQSKYYQLRDLFWECVDLEISLQKCFVFSFTNTLASTPFMDDNCIWSFAYFFYNKKFNRLLVFICRSLRNNQITEFVESLGINPFSVDCPANIHAFEQFENKKHYY